MEIALDTNCVIDLLNGNVDFTEFKSRYSAVYLPATVLGELFFGAEKSSKKQENYQKITGFVANCNVIEITEAVAVNMPSVEKNCSTTVRQSPKTTFGLL